MAKQQRFDPQSLPARNTVVPPAVKSKSGRPGGRPPGAAPIHKATAADWIAGARLRTVPLAIGPVLLGTATAYVIGEGAFHWVRALLCLAVALGLQIGVNYANDYSDGIRGTDNVRVGPARLTGSGAAKPRTVLTVALTFFALAAAAGLLVVVLSGQYILLAVGAAAIVAGWFYTGGKKPYGYFGLGELFVFVFFGLVATAGTTFVQVGTVNLETWLAGVAVGFFACAVLVANNLRDIKQDRIAGKRTLSVLIGDRASRVVYAVLMLLPFGILGFFSLLYLNAPYTYFVLLAAVPAVVIAITAKTPAELILVLKLTTLTSLLYSIGLAWAIAF